MVTHGSTDDHGVESDGTGDARPTERSGARSKASVPALGRIALVVGDLAALAGFVAAGLLVHHINPLVFPEHAVMTALPFVIGWAIVAPLGGLYRLDVVRSPLGTGVRVVAVWAVASTLGAGIRATPLFHGGAPPEFIAVNLVFGTAFLLPWRLAATGAYRFGANASA